MITSLKPDEIFVFGSNTAGIHGAGAARQARDHFGAKMNIGEGLMGQSYALPTLRASFSVHDELFLEKRTLDELIFSIKGFFECCLNNPDKTFLLTKVGCGLAGYTEEYMLDAFASASINWTERLPMPTNIIWPDGWNGEKNPRIRS